MSRLLVPVDVSEQSLQAVRFAIAYARNQHELTLLHVIPPLPARYLAMSRLGETNVEQQQLEEAREDMKKIVALVEQAGVKHSVELQFGEPHEVIARQAKNGYDAIVMGTHGYGRMLGFLLQSVSYPTLHDVEIPVFLIAEETDGQRFPWKNVLLAVDGSKQAMEAVRKAIQFGQDRDTRYTLLTVVTLPVAYAGVYGTGWEDTETLETWGQETLRPYEEMLEASGVPYTSKVMIGDPAMTIKTFAKETEADLIVLGHHGLGGFAGTLLGSVTFKLIHRTKTPLLVVKS